MENKCSKCYRRTHTKSCWCFVKSKSVEKMTAEEVESCDALRDFPIYSAIDLELYEKGKLTKEEILEKQESERDKYPTYEEIQEHNKQVELFFTEKKEPESEKTDYSTLAVAELKSICKERGIKGYSKLTKAEIVKLLEDK